MIQERTIDYEHNGTALEGFLAYDDAKPGPLPGVLISHAWAGREKFECDKARALAELGYAGFALDLYGKGVIGSSPEENTKLMQPFLDDRVMLQSRLTTALSLFQAQPEVDANRIVAMGFCFGGLCVLDLARIGADVRGVVSFHGLFIPPGNTAGNTITAKVLALHGHRDPMVPVEAVNDFEKELVAAGADWQIHVYGNAMHAFTNPAANDASFGTLYDADTDRRSWQTLLNFLDEVLT
jgi:dienelactone hydrolase